jgi:hypothetical protein
MGQSPVFPCGLHEIGKVAHIARTVQGNNCAGNVFAGLLITGSACRVDKNHCTGGQRGVQVTGTDNMVVRNSAQGNSVLNFDIVAGNHDAARVTSPGASFASTSPWANFSF